MQDIKIANNTLYQVITKTFTSASGFIITLLLARYYGAEGYGDFTKITAFISMFYIIIDFGLNAIFLQLEDKKNRFANLLALRILLSIIIVITVNIAIILLPTSSARDIGFPPAIRLSALIFSTTIISQAILLSSVAVFQKKLRYDLYMLSMVSGTLITLLLILFFAIKQLPLEYILLSYLIGSAVSAIISLRIVKERIIPFTLNKEFAITMLKSSYPVGLMLFFNLIYFRADIIILSFYKNTTDVALYGYAYKYFEFLLAIPLFLSNAIYPFLLESLKNLRRHYALARKYILIFITLSILIAIAAWITAPLIATVKKDFIPSIFIFQILLLSLPIFFLTNILQWILIAQKQKKYLLNTYIACALLNIALNIIFIPKYNYLAPAVITGISEAAVLILLIYKFTTQKLQENYSRKNYES